MNAIIADFVGLLGPGQIVDRHALVAVPAGFLKVGIVGCCYITARLLFLHCTKMDW